MNFLIKKNKTTTAVWYKGFGVSSVDQANHKEIQSELKAASGETAVVKIVGKVLWKYKFSVTAGSEQAEVKDVDYYQIVSPVEQVEDKEDGREEVHGNPATIKALRNLDEHK